MPIPKKHKLDIFQLLGSISKKKRALYSSLTEEEQKALQPLVVMRWLSGTKDARQIFFLNELVNPFVFPMAKHKELLVDLMECCSDGTSRRYFWNKAKPKKSASSSKAARVIADYFGYSMSDAIDAMPLLTNDDIMEYAELLGRQLDEIKLLKKELKDRARAPVSV